jgi:hypothetical protein
MIAAGITAVSFLGTMEALELGRRVVHEAGVVDKALEIAEGRLEAKRSVRWCDLLEDDLDLDGTLESLMRDDGQGHDEVAGDGVFTGSREREGITEVWSIQADRPGPIASVGSVTIQSLVVYVGSNGLQELRLETLRSNPAFVGVPQL